MKRGLFIAFEGIDGCGKSTQARKLAKHILELNKYNHILITREPFRDTKIRKILREDDNPYSQAYELAKLYTEDRKKHVKEMIIPNLKIGNHVICDRYSFSTLSYQQAQGIDVVDLLNMHKGLPIADVIFILDVSENTAMKRMKKDKKRMTEQKFEKDKNFIKKLRHNYLELAENLEGHNVIVVDGTKSINHIFEKQIKPAFDKLYKKYISS